MSTVNLEIEIPERIRGTDLEKMLLEKAQKHALEQAVVELYKRRIDINRHRRGAAANAALRFYPVPR
jgi:hypothetical protein